MGLFGFLFKKAAKKAVKELTKKPKKKAPDSYSGPIPVELSDNDFNEVIKITMGSTSTTDDEKPALGQITKNDKGWVMNPKCDFEITLKGIDNEAQAVKKILDSYYIDNDWEAPKKLLPFLIKAQWCEYDDYMSKYLPLYKKAVGALIAESDEWEYASELDRTDLLKEFNRKAVKGIPVVPQGYNELLILVEGYEMENPLPTDFVEKYGIDNILIYIKHRKRLGKTINMPSDNLNRESFEKIHKAGLAIRGSQIPLEMIIQSLTIKQMNELISDLNHPNITRKKAGADFLITLNDIEQRLSKILSFRSLFTLVDVRKSFTSINLDDFSKFFTYHKTISELLLQTYQKTGDDREDYLRDMADFDNIEGWEFETGHDPCPKCTEAANKSYDLRQRPTVPLHIGCDCHVSALW